MILIIVIKQKLCRINIQPGSRSRLIKFNIWEVRKVYPREKIFEGLIHNPTIVRYKYRSYCALNFTRL